ncbi:MAG: hypothetical protein K6B44_13535 [Lachnospiraceae bacterium]|nr:hypothetical protein [Lachnospiraceae bacterium]
MDKRAKYILSMTMSVVLILFLYILAHETGHMIVMLSAGAVIDDFSIIGAHVSSHGGEYTPVSAMWMHANGAFLPVVVSLIYMLFYKKDSQNLIYKVFSLFVAIVPFSSLLAWVIIPFVYMGGQAPAGDDVTKFLDVFTQYAHPLAVSAGTVILIAIGVLTAVKKQIFGNYYREIRNLRAELVQDSKEKNSEKQSI